MKTAKLVTTSFQIICPNCLQVQVNEDESILHTGDTKESGQVLRCSNEECRLMFRLPKTLKAEVK